MVKVSMLISAAVGGWLVLHAPLALAQQLDGACSTATELGNLELGTLVLPYLISGSLDSTPEAPDLDYYRITGGTPGTQLRVSARADATSAGSGTLIGFFDSTCGWMDVGQTLMITVPDDGVVILAVTQEPDYGFAGGGIGPYEIDVSLAEPIGSISGTVVDRDTGEPLQGDVWLFQCSTPDLLTWTEVSYSWPDANGRFTFTQTEFGAPLTAGTYCIEFVQPDPSPHELYLGAPFSVAAHEHLELGQLLVAPIGNLGSISGRVVDATTQQPLSGTSEPFTLVYFQSCNTNGCSWNEVYPDASGRFHVDRDFMGGPLYLGELDLYVAAPQYLLTHLHLTNLSEGQDVDLGDIAVQSNPIRFSDLSSCANVPSTGGRCRFSVGVINGGSDALRATVWAEIEASGLGSPIDFSRFTLGQQRMGFGPGVLGAKKTATFDLVIPAAVKDQARFCAVIYAGQGAANPFLAPIGLSNAFCLIKDPGAAAYRQLSRRESLELMNRPLDAPDGHPETHLLRERSKRRLDPARRDRVRD